MIDQLLSYLAPHICCSCHTVGSLLCNSCKYDIISDGFGVCVACLRPLAPSNLCRKCRNSLPFTDAYVISWRSGALKSLIDQYKFERAKEGAAILSQILDETLPTLPSDCTIVPIPTLSQHTRQRGYDHMQDIARQLASYRRLPYQSPLRHQSKAVQHGSTLSERKRQAKTMFTIDTSVIFDSPLLLIDDIYTTGSTVLEAAKLLSRHTDQPIYLAIIARQPVDSPLLVT